MDKSISVIIVDDHPLVLSGFEYILSDVSAIVLSGSFTSAADALHHLQSQAVDVVLMDINMPDMNGIDATMLIKKRHPEVAVIAISNLNEASVASRMLQSGASGYLLKNASANELIQAIVDAHAGITVLSEEMKSVLHAKPLDVPVITRREREVLDLLATGQTTPAIAEALFISKLTVETHRRNLLQKFNVNNSAALIHKAGEMKFI